MKKTTKPAKRIPPSAVLDISTAAPRAIAPDADPSIKQFMAHRARLHMNNSQLASAAGVSVSLVQKIVNGKRPAAPADALARLAGATPTRLTLMASGDGTPPAALEVVTRDLSPTAIDALRHAIQVTPAGQPIPLPWAALTLAIQPHDPPWDGAFTLTTMVDGRLRHTCQLGAGASGAWLAASAWFETTPHGAPALTPPAHQWCAIRTHGAPRATQDLVQHLALAVLLEARNYQYRANSAHE